MIFFTVPAPTDIYPLSLYDALPIFCNARILRDTPFRNSYIQCAASDDGTSIGAALYVWHVLLGKPRVGPVLHSAFGDRKSTRLNSSHRCISYAVFCLKKKNHTTRND